jgi:hypothetical protein
MAVRTKKITKIRTLQRGDIIQSVVTGHSFVVVLTGDEAMAVDVVQVTAPAEWRVVVVPKRAKR